MIPWMADPNRVFDVMRGEGYAVGNIDAMGDGYGFRKVRRELDVSAFGIHVLVIHRAPPAPLTITSARRRSISSIAARSRSSSAMARTTFSVRERGPRGRFHGAPPPQRRVRGRGAADRGRRGRIRRPRWEARRRRGGVLNAHLAKADYAVRAAIELATSPDGRPVKAERIATAQDIPLNFLENILGEMR